MEMVGSTLIVASPRRQWWRAIKAIVRLAINTEDTTQVFEIIHGLGGDNMERVYKRMRSLPDGQRLLRAKPSLNALLCNGPWLESQPEGSLARVYLKFMTDGGITPEGLLAAQEAAAVHDKTPLVEEDADRFYIGQRLVEMHDLWHVLSGYGRDDTGELANLWFSYGQFGQLGMGFIAFMGTLDGPRHFWWIRYMRRAYRRGHAAQFLVATPMEEMLSLPIDEARQRLGVSLPRDAHPNGMLTGNRSKTGIGRGPALTHA
jgi:ubiquinone biosynthesis protein COQ4